MPLAGKPTAFVQCGQWVYPLAAGKSPVLKSAPTTYMFPELGRDGEWLHLKLAPSTGVYLPPVSTRGTAHYLFCSLGDKRLTPSLSHTFVLCAAESCSVGVVLDGASAEELRLLDSFLQSHSLLRTSEDSGEVAPGNSKMVDVVEDPTWGGTLAKVHLPSVAYDGGGRRDGGTRRGGEGREGELR